MSRITISFVAVVMVATFSLTALMGALTKAASPTVGATVATTGIALFVSLGLGGRLLLVSDRARRAAEDGRAEGPDDAR